MTFAPDHRRHGRTRAGTTLLLTGLVLSGCGGAGDATGDDDRTLTVLAAASLQRPLEQVVADFERSHDGVDVVLSFAGSSELATQVVEGAEADVLATADERTMSTVTDAGLTDGDPRVFATNSMTIITPDGNPAGVAGLDDLARDGLDVVVCAPQVPCGAATERVEEAAGITLHPVSEESKVTDVVGKVSSGEADAGIVYVSDAVGRDGVEAVTIPATVNTTNDYPVAVLRDSSRPTLARELADALVGDGAGTGASHLRAAGFSPP